MGETGKSARRIATATIPCHRAIENTDQQEPDESLDRILSGPPPLAPLPFPNLVILGLIGLSAMLVHLSLRRD